MLSRIIRLLLLISYTFHVGSVSAQPQAIDPATIASEKPTITIGVYAHPPFAMKDGDQYTGMAIELWEDMAAQLNLAYTYADFNNIGDLVKATESGTVDVALTNMTVTKTRAMRIDFTHPWFDAGQRILVSNNSSTGFWSVLQGLSESGHLKAYGWIFLIILMATLLVTLFDRRFDKAFPERWRDGIAESFYTVMAVATSGRPPARKNLFGWIGRIWQGLWLACGVAVLAYVTSSITSVMTTLSLTSQINSAADLAGHIVGVQPGSIAEEYAQEAGLDTRTFDKLEEATQALAAGKIDAIIDDAPVLEYYTHINPGLPFAVVGPIFEPDKYAFGLPPESDLTRPLSIELIGAHESGLIEEIRAKYFGPKS